MSDNEKELSTEEEAPSLEDIIVSNSVGVDAIVDLLIKKGIITEKEFVDTYEEIFEEEPEEDSE